VFAVPEPNHITELGDMDRYMQATLERFDVRLVSATPPAPSIMYVYGRTQIVAKCQTG
jgi:hypothetical protein